MKRVLHQGLSILLILWSAMGSYAQTEKLSLQMNKNFYLSGESLWFKVAILNEDTSEIQSRIAYVDLVSPENRLIERAKLSIRDRVSSGRILLPYTTDEGYYLLRVYTLHNLNYGDQGILSVQVPVFNPLESDITSFTPDDTTKMSVTWDDKDLLLRLPRIQYAQRDTITLDISTTRDMSLAVAILEAATPPHQPRVLEASAGRSSDRFQVERSLTINGILTDPESGAKINSPVISVYNGESRSFLRARSEDGHIKIPVPEFAGTSTFQVYNLNPYQKAVNRFELLDINYNFSEYTNEAKPILTESIAQYILKSIKRRKIHELLGMDLYSTASQTRMKQKEVVPDYTYPMAKYQNIRTLEEFIDEGIFAARVRKRKDKTEIRLFNAEDKFTFEDPPWYIVDGIITNNESKVLAIPFKDIQEVNLYTKTSTIKKYFEHFLWRNGVIEVITNDVKYRRQFSSEPNTVQLKGYTESHDFFGTLPVAINDLPDVRGDIFWMPHLGVEANKKLQLRVPHSDESGDFIIRVTGISQDGKTYKKEIHYSVSGK